MFLCIYVCIIHDSICSIKLRMNFNITLHMWIEKLKCRRKYEKAKRDAEVIFACFSISDTSNSFLFWAILLLPYYTRLTTPPRARRTMIVFKPHVHCMYMYVYLYVLFLYYTSTIYTHIHVDG